MKRQPLEWEEIIANETTDKELILKNIQAAHTLNIRETKNPIINRKNDLYRHFSKEDIQTANKLMKRCSTLLIIREL